MKIYANESGNDVKKQVQDICNQYNFVLRKFTFSDTKYGSYYIIKCSSEMANGYGVSVTIDSDYKSVDINVKADIQVRKGADYLISQIEDARNLADEITGIIGIRW